MKSYSIHLLFTGIGFGGSGKRFLGIANSISCNRRSFKIYTTLETHERLIKQFDIKANKYISFFIVGDYKKSQRSLNKSALKILSENYKSGDIVHIHGIHPFLPFWKYKYIYSYICMYLPFENKIKLLFSNRSKATEKELLKSNKISFKKSKKEYIKIIFKSLYRQSAEIILIIFSNYLDILNPIVFFKIKSFLFLKKISFTKGIAPPSTFLVKTNTLKRENKIVFLGRFDTQKGVKSILNIIPDLSKYLEQKEIKYKIDFIGEGDLLKEIQKVQKSINKNFLEIRIYSSDNIIKDINKAKIFLSVQDYSNYPSRSLTEAMCLGLIPIVSDTGESRLMLPYNYPYLLDYKNLEDELLRSLQTIIIMKEKEQIALSDYIFNFSKKRFSRKKHITYFENIYEKLHSGTL